MSETQQTDNAIPADRLLLTKEEAAKLLGVSVRSIEYLRERGRLKSVRVGKAFHFRPTALEQFISDNES